MRQVSHLHRDADDAVGDLGPSAPRAASAGAVKEAVQHFMVVPTRPPGALRLHQVIGG